MHPDIMLEKNKLIRENKEALDKGDNNTVAVSTGIEKKLIAMAKEKFKDDPAMALYASGARGSIEVHYKNNHLMKGVIPNKITKKMDFVGNSLQQGIRKEDIPAYGNLIVAGAFSSAKGTQIGGYLTKRILMLMQNEAANSDPNSDCGTTRTIQIKVTELNKKALVYRNFKEGNRDKQLTSDNLDRYINSTLNFYSPMCCLSNDTVCAKCLGSMFYKLDMLEIGALATRITSSITQSRLKAKHDASQAVASLDVNDLLI
jgi:hypothetical protein